MTNKGKLYCRRGFATRLHVCVAEPVLESLSPSLQTQWRRRRWCESSRKLRAGEGAPATGRAGSKPPDGPVSPAGEETGGKGKANAALLAGKKAMTEEGIWDLSH